MDDDIKTRTRRNASVAGPAEPRVAETLDPNDVIPVPAEMYPAELDARGDAVNSVQRAEGLPVPKTHDEDRGASYG